MNIVLLASHAVAEYDDLRMFTDLGFDCFAPGGYEVPGTEGEGIRPPLPDAPHHPDLVARLHEVRAERGEPGPAIDWGKAALHDDIIDWADAIIVHHFPDRWIGGQWERIKHKRVIWRTCGQSDPRLEEFMAGFDGLQIVRYSPKERLAFEKVGCFAGEDAVIRFGKYPDDYGPYVGDWQVVGNLTQDMLARGDSTGLGSWRKYTEGLPTMPAGKGSEHLPGGVGALSYPDMLEYLRRIRTYFYTGTIPASYTLGLIEAMLSGVPVVAIGLLPPSLDWQWVADISEAEDIANPGLLLHHIPLDAYLRSHEYAARRGAEQRARAIEMFDVATVGAQWREFLS